MLLSDENANKASSIDASQVQQIFDEYVLKDDDYRTRNPLEVKKVVGNTSSFPSTSKLSVGGSTDISTKLLTNEVPCLNENICQQISREQCNNFTGENLSTTSELKNECAHDCNGDLIGGCELIEEWHLPFIGAEVVCVSDSMSGENERNNGDYDLTANIESEVTQSYKDANNYLDETFKPLEEVSLPMVSYTTKCFADLTYEKDKELQM